MKNKILIAILIFSLAFNFAVIGTFIYKEVVKPDRYKRDGHGIGFDRKAVLPYFNEMALNDKQRKKMTDLFQEFHESNREVLREISILERKLSQNLRSDENNIAATDSILNKISNLKLKQSKKAINHFTSVKRFLSPRQQEHFFRILMEKRPPRSLRGNANRKGFKMFPGESDSLGKGLNKQE